MTANEPNSPVAQALFDQLLISLLYLRKRYPQIDCRSGAVVFFVLTAARYLTEKQRKELGNNDSLLKLIEANSKRIHTHKDGIPDATSVPKIASDKYLLVIVEPSQEFDLKKCVEPEGHLLILTDAGIQYALSVRKQYKEFSYAQFLEAWAKNARRLRMAYLDMKRRQRQRD